MKSVIFLIVGLTFVPFAGVKSQEIQTYLTGKVANESNGFIKLINYTKTAGAERIVNGQTMYDLYFTADIEPIKDVYKTGNQTRNTTVTGVWTDFKLLASLPQGELNTYANALTGDVRTYKGKEAVRLTGYAELLKAETGWKINKLVFSKEEKVEVALREEIKKTELAAESNRMPDANQLTIRYIAKNAPVNETEYGEVTFRNGCTSCDATQAKILLNELSQVLRNSTRIQVVDNNQGTQYATYYTKVSLSSMSFSFSKTPTGEFSTGRANILLQVTQTDAAGKQVAQDGAFNIGEMSNSLLHSTEYALFNYTTDRIALKTKIFFLYFIPLKAKVNLLGDITKKGEVKTIMVANNHELDESLKYNGFVYEKGDITANGRSFKNKNTLATVTLKKFDTDQIEFKVAMGGELIKSMLDAGKELEVLIQYKR